MSYKNVSSQLCRPVSFVSNSNHSSSLSSSGSCSVSGSGTGPGFGSGCSSVSGSSAALITNHSNNNLTSTINNNNTTTTSTTATTIINNNNNNNNSINVNSNGIKSPNHFSYRSLNSEHFRPYFDTQYSSGSASSHAQIALLSSQSTSYGSENTAPLSTYTHLSSDSGSALNLVTTSDPPIHDSSYVHSNNLNSNSIDTLQPSFASSALIASQSHTQLLVPSSATLSTSLSSSSSSSPSPSTPSSSASSSPINYQTANCLFEPSQGIGEQGTLVVNYRQLLNQPQQPLQPHQSTPVYHPHVQPPIGVNPLLIQTAPQVQHPVQPQLYYQYGNYQPVSHYQSNCGSFVANGGSDRRASSSTYAGSTPAVYTPTQNVFDHVYQHVPSPIESLPITWRRVHEHLRHLCAAHLTCVLLVLLPILLAALLICAFVLQERSDKQHLHQYAIYAFVVFCVAFICPFALFFVLVLINKAVRKYHKCFHPHLAAAAEFAEYGFNPYPHFAFTFPTSANHSASGVSLPPVAPLVSSSSSSSTHNYHHWPTTLSSSSSSFAREQFLADASAVIAAAATIGIQLGPYEAAQLIQAQRPISTLNVQQLGATTATGNASGSSGTTSGATGTANTGRLSGSSVSSLLLGADQSSRQRQRLIRQDAFECPPDYAHLPDGCAPYHAHDQPPSYELALLCPSRKSMDEPISGSSTGGTTSGTSATSGTSVAKSNANESASASASGSSNTSSALRKPSLESTGKRSPKGDEHTPPPPYDEKTMGFR